MVAARRIVVLSVAAVGLAVCGASCARQHPTADHPAALARAQEQEPAREPVQEPAAGMRRPTVNDVAPLEMPGLHNIVAFSDDAYSGSAPTGRDGFESLRALGVRTIISVDGAVPDVEAARVHGMRYVHLPIGYDGIERDRMLELARAVRDLPHPVYLHCHHGKHRSAAAMGAVAVTLGWSTPQHATQRMHISGTSPSYAGLFECVASASMSSSSDLDSADGTFPPTWTPTDLVQAMVEAEHAFENLKHIEQSGWRSPPDHPDLVPAAEAGRLADLLRHLLQDSQVQSHPADFQHRLVAASRECEILESALAGELGSAERLSAALEQISKSCRDCHRTYRDRGR